MRYTIFQNRFNGYSLQDKENEAVAELAGLNFEA